MDFFIQYGFENPGCVIPFDHFDGTCRRHTGYQDGIQATTGKFAAGKIT